MSDPVVRVFGIRHHGPGSARRLVHVLRDWQPDCLLVEAPADAQAELRQAQLSGLEPPVALVLYDEADIQHAIFLPFARFSPEWQAVRWALDTGAEVRPIDLPARHMLALRRDKPASPQLDLIPGEPAEASADEQLRRDPLSVVAAAAGYDDSERWWDATLERQDDDTTVFDEVLELMRALREAYPDADKPETLLREAFMRQELRAAVQDGFRRIAVVCGAWHAPALADAAGFPIGADRKKLKGLPKVKVKAAWVPWSYAQLARTSGYTAGVISPAWYELLYDYAGQAPGHWMVRTAHLLREEGLDASPAHTLEAVRLATTLSRLRGFAHPGTEELEEASLSTLAEGRRERLDLIRRRHITGEKVGRVPEAAAAVPLQRDLQSELKSARLQKYWEQPGEHYLKATKANARGGIDLRQEADLRKSHLLHRLRLLDIPWGTVQSAGPNDRGSFKEIWLLRWQPLFVLRILEAARWGSTVREAAARLTRQRAAKTETLPELSRLVREALQADLTEVAPDLITQLRDRSAVSRDTLELLAALPELVRIVQYGDTRRTDVTALVLLVGELIPRVAIGLPAAAADIDDEQAHALHLLLRQVHHAIALLDLPDLREQWLAGVRQLPDRRGVHPLLQGAATRLLFDREELPPDLAEQYFRRALSPANGAPSIAQWIEGFLHGSGLLLLHHPPLWKLVDDWVGSLSPDAFPEVLPLLRRTFSLFQPAERRQLLELARRVARPRAAASLAPPPETFPSAAVVPDDELLASLRQWIR